MLDIASAAKVAGKPARGRMSTALSTPKPGRPAQASAPTPNLRSRHVAQQRARGAHLCPHNGNIDRVVKAAIKQGRGLPLAQACTTAQRAAGSNEKQQAQANRAAGLPLSHRNATQYTFQKAATRYRRHKV